MNYSVQSSKFKKPSNKNMKMSNEEHIENFIKSVSPFKDVLKMDREQSAYVGSSAGINSFLPSLNEHK